MKKTSELIRKASSPSTQQDRQEGSRCLVQSHPPGAWTHWQESNYNVGVSQTPRCAPPALGLAPGTVQFTSRSHREPGEVEEFTREDAHTIAHPWNPGQKQLIAKELKGWQTYLLVLQSSQRGRRHPVLPTDPGASISGSLFYPGCAGEHQFGILPLGPANWAGTSQTRHLISTHSPKTGCLQTSRAWPHTQHTQAADPGWKLHNEPHPLAKRNHSPAACGPATSNLILLWDPWALEADLRTFALPTNRLALASEWVQVSLVRRIKM